MNRKQNDCQDRMVCGVHRISSYVQTLRMQNNEQEGELPLVVYFRHCSHCFCDAPPGSPLSGRWLPLCCACERLLAHFTQRYAVPQVPNKESLRNMGARANNSHDDSSVLETSCKIKNLRQMVTSRYSSKQHY
jgi:hypothetical protein